LLSILVVFFFCPPVISLMRLSSLCFGQRGSRCLLCFSPRTELEVRNVQWTLHLSMATNRAEVSDRMPVYGPRQVSGNARADSQKQRVEKIDHADRRALGAWPSDGTEPLNHPAGGKAGGRASVLPCSKARELIASSTLSRDKVRLRPTAIRQKY